MIAPGRMRPLPPPMTAACDAPWCGATKGGRVMSRASCAGPESPEHRVDRRDLHRLGLAERRQQSGQPLGQHRLAGAGRTREQQVVTAGSRDLERELGVGLADDLAEVAHRLRWRWCDQGHRHLVHAAALAQGGVAPDELRDVGHRMHLHAGHEARLARVGDRDDDMPHPREGGRSHERQHPRYRTHGAVEPDLADVDDVAHDADLHEIHGGGDGDEDAEVEAGADLALSRRGQVDGDAALAHRHLLDERGCGLDAVGGLLDGRVAQTADREARQPLGELRAPVVHRQQHPGDREPRIELPLDQPERVEQPGEALEREVLRLDRHDHPVGGHQRIDGQRPERRRTVEQREGVLVTYGGERVAQTDLRAGRRGAPSSRRRGPGSR